MSTYPTTDGSEFRLLHVVPCENNSPQLGPARKGSSNSTTPQVSAQEAPAIAVQSAGSSPEPVEITAPPASKSGSPKPKVVFYHRVREVRKQQGISDRSICRRLNIDAKSLRELEEPTNDLKLSQLAAIQQALDVPLIDLLEDNGALSRPVEERAKLVKIMKTAVALKELKGSTRVGRLANMLCEQLVDLMPELADVGGWPQFGARRGSTAVGKALEQPINLSHLGLSD